MAGQKQDKRLSPAEREEQARRRLRRAALGLERTLGGPPPSPQASLAALAAGFVLGYSPRARQTARTAVRTLVDFLRSG